MTPGPLHIFKTMPHRYPMLLVDEALEGADPDSAVSFKNITFNEPCYRGLADVASMRQLAYPLALLIESFAQGAGLLLARRGFLDGAGSAVVFGDFRDIEIIDDVHPGDRVRHEVRLESCQRPLAVLTGRSCVGEREVARFGRLSALRVQVDVAATGCRA